MKHSILCVDDDVNNVDAIERLLRRKYQVFKATSGAEALKLLSNHNVSVIVSDQRMAHMTGVELLAESLKLQPNALRILLTGYTDIESVVAAVNSGQIYRYVTKPWDPNELQMTIDTAVDRFEVGQKLIEKNRELEEALTELRSLDRAKTQFMMLINHELKTPLTSIASFTDLLAETKLEQDQRRMLARVQQSTVRLRELVDDSLTLVASQAGLTELELKAINIKAIINEKNLDLRILNLAESRRLNFIFTVAEKNLTIDERRMGDVFRRLVHNAVKFANPGTAIVVNGSAKRDSYVVEIQNQGQSVDAAKLSGLLKPFTLNENILNHSSGSGLGLSICEALLNLHGTHLKLSTDGAMFEASFSLQKV